MLITMHKCLELNLKLLEHGVKSLKKNQGS